jgi:Tol biopolymer transport system component
MATRWWRVMTCAARLGLVAGVGCGARELDPNDPAQDASPTTPAKDAGMPMPNNDAGAEMPPRDAGVEMPAADAGRDLLVFDAVADLSGIGIDAGPVTGAALDAWIAFDSDGAIGNRDLYVIRADGTGRRRLTNGTSTEAQPTFSRDGTKLAFTSDRNTGVMQIYWMDLATGVVTRVSQRSEGAHDAAFAPDGTLIGYRSGVLVYTANLDGSEEHQVTDGQTCCMGRPFGGPVFLADGQTVIYDDYNAIYSTANGGHRKTIVMPTTGEQSHPALSLDGSTLVLQATCANDNAARSLWMVPAATTTNYSCTGGSRISPHGTDATHASWGPDSMVVWGSVAGGTNHSNPVPSALLSWQTGALRIVTTGSDGDDRNPSWSPAGTVIGDW